MRVVISEIIRGCKSTRRFVFDLDDGKYPVCYRSRTSSNAFFHSLKQRNWKGGKDPQNFKTLYHFKLEEDFRRETEHLKKFLNTIDCKLPEDYNQLIELPNLWEFYKEIGWDYKSKKWIK